MRNTGFAVSVNASLLRCPLLLFSGETISELDLLLRMLQSGGYTPLSLHDLFLCRRGVRRWPTKPCSILLRGLSAEELRTVLPVLQTWEIPVALFLQNVLMGREIEEVMRCRFISCFAEADMLVNGTFKWDSVYVLPNTQDRHTAAFCDTVGADMLTALRRIGVRMLVTVCGAALPKSVPPGIDVLSAVSVAKGSSLPELLARYQASLSVRMTDALSVFLPLAREVIFSDLELAIPLSIVGTDPKRFERFLAGADWKPVFDPVEGRYWLQPSWSGVIDEQVKSVRMGEDPLALIHRALKAGVYVRLRTGEFRLSGRCSYSPSSLLLFGYDGGYGAFSVMTALEPGSFERVDLLPETLTRLCGDSACVLTLLTVSEERIPCELSAVCKRVAAGFQSGLRSDGVCSGWQATVLFANRLETLGASEQNPLSAASVRTFLEERLLTGFRLRYFEQEADLFLAPLNRYMELLEQEVRPALLTLRGRETLITNHASFLLLCDLLRRLLSAEEACLRSLLAEADRVDAMAAFLCGRESGEDFRKKR